MAGRPLTEDQLLAEVTALCDHLGLLWFHRTDRPRSSQGRKGFPDLVIAGPSGVIFRELKSERGETTAAQDLWAWTLYQAGIDQDPACGRLWLTWRPEDWRSGDITSELRSLARHSS